PYLEEDLAEEEPPPPSADEFELTVPEDAEPEPLPPEPPVLPATTPRLVGPITAVARAVPVIPVKVDLVAGPGATELAIPLEIVLNNGAATVNLNLRLSLNIKLS